MRVSRGIFRLWVFVTALWLGGTAAITYLNWPKSTAPTRGMKTSRASCCL